MGISSVKARNEIPEAPPLKFSIPQSIRNYALTILGHGYQPRPDGKGDLLGKVIRNLTEEDLRVISKNFVGANINFLLNKQSV